MIFLLLGRLTIPSPDNGSIELRIYRVKDRIQILLLVRIRK